MGRPGMIFAVLIGWAANGAPVRAELRCDEARVDAGEVKAGRPLSQRFTFCNRGPETIEITEVRPSCGCLKPRLEQRRYRRGETGILVLEVNTLTTPAGPNVWRVQLLYAENGQARDLTLGLTAQVTTEIVVQPPALVLHTGTAIGQEVTITDVRPMPLKITAVRTTLPQIRARYGEGRRDEAGRWVQSVRLDVQADCPEGRHDATLHIATSDPTYPEFKVPVTVVKRIQQSVSVVPAELTWAEPAGQPLPARLVRLRGPADQDVEVASAACDDPAVRCTWAKGPERMATLKVQLDPARVSREGLHTTVHIQLRLPGAETIILAVHCVPR